MSLALVKKSPNDGAAGPSRTAPRSIYTDAGGSFVSSLAATSGRRPTTTDASSTPVERAEAAAVECRTLVSLLDLERYSKKRNPVACERTAADRHAGGYLTLSSALLRDSYLLPLKEADGVLEKLHAAVEERRRLHKPPHYNDLSCFVCQGEPDAPPPLVKLTLDVDCLRCKERTKQRRPCDNNDDGQDDKAHFSYGTVVTHAVLCYYTILGKPPRRVHMTVGNTCGLHLFFNDHLLPPETCERVKSAIVAAFENDADKCGAAALDTGASSLPFPLGRGHVQVYDVIVYLPENKNGKTVGFRKVKRPGARELRGVSNFCLYTGSETNDAVDPVTAAGRKRAPSCSSTTLSNRPKKARPDPDNAAATGSTVQRAPLSPDDDDRGKDVIENTIETSTAGADGSDPTAQASTPPVQQNGGSDTAVGQFHTFTTPSTPRETSERVTSAQRNKRSVDAITVVGDECSPSAERKRRLARIHLSSAAATSSASLPGDMKLTVAVGRRAAETESSVLTTSSVYEEQEQEHEEEEEQRDYCSTILRSGANGDEIESHAPSFSFSDNERTSNVDVTPTEESGGSFRFDSAVDVGRWAETAAAVTEAGLIETVKNSNYGSVANMADARFADKTVLRQLVEEEEVEHRTNRHRLGDGGSRVYLERKASGERPDPVYKVQINMHKVRRAVYEQDIMDFAEWNAMLCSYYDSHMHNPLFLYTLQTLLLASSQPTAVSAGSVLNVKTNRPPQQVLRPALHGVRRALECFANGGDQDRGAAPSPSADDKFALANYLVWAATNVYGISTAVFSDLFKLACRVDCTGDGDDNLNRTVGGDCVDYDDDNNDDDDDKNNKTHVPGVNRWSTSDAKQSASDGRSVLPYLTTPKPRYEEDRGYDDVDVDDSVSQVGIRTSAPSNGSLADTMSTLREVGPVRRPYEPNRNTTAPPPPSVTAAKPAVVTSRSESRDSASNCYRVLGSLLFYGDDVLSDDCLFSLLFYYHRTPSSALLRIVTEMYFDGIMVTAVVHHYLLQAGGVYPIGNAFAGFCSVLKAANGIADEDDDNDNGNREDGDNARARMPPPPPQHNRRRGNRQATAGGIALQAGGGTESVRRKKYAWTQKHLIDLMIRYYFRPVNLGDDRVVFSSRGYDVSEDAAVEIGKEKLQYRSKKKNGPRLVAFNTKHELSTAFQSHRTLQPSVRCPLFYNTDVMNAGHECTYTMNLVLKKFEITYGGCMSVLTRCVNDLFTERSRFNGLVYGAAAECRTATVDLTNALDLSYVNLVLRQPVVSPMLEHDFRIRSLFVSSEEFERGSFVCLNLMDYVRVLNLYDKAGSGRGQVMTRRKVESFLDSLLVDGVGGGDRRANRAGDMNSKRDFRTILVFYLTYLYEVVYQLRMEFYGSAGRLISVERLAYELDVHGLVSLLFESDFTHVDGLEPETLVKNMSLEPTRGLLDALKEVSGRSSRPASEAAAAAGCTTIISSSSGDGLTDGVQAVATTHRGSVLADKEQRVKALFGSYGYDAIYGTSQSNDREHWTETTARSENVPDSESPTVPPQQAATSQYQQPDAGDDEDVAAGVVVAAEAEDQRKKNYERLLRLNTAHSDEAEVAIYGTRDWYDSLLCRLETNIREDAATNAYCTGSSDTVKGRLVLADQIEGYQTREIVRHVRYGRLQVLVHTIRNDADATSRLTSSLTRLPLRLKLLAFVLATHTVKRLSHRVAGRVVARVKPVYENGTRVVAAAADAEEAVGSETANNNNNEHTAAASVPWQETWSSMLNRRYELLTYCRDLADTHFPHNFFAGLDPAAVYETLYTYMKGAAERNAYPEFTRLVAKNEPLARDIAVAFMYVLVMSAYDKEQVDLYLRVFLACEWPGQWAKTAFVWKSNSNAGKSYLFDSIFKTVCANSASINDPKDGKEAAPEKADYNRNFVLYSEEFSKASVGELNRLISVSQLKFRMNFHNNYMKTYTMGKLMFNCNTMPDIHNAMALVMRLVMFNVPFSFSRRYCVSDALLNWLRDAADENPPSPTEAALRENLCSLLTADERNLFRNHLATRNEAELYDEEDAASSAANAAKSHNGSSMFIVQNKTSLQYLASNPPTTQITTGLFNITRHFSWIRYTNTPDVPVSFEKLPAACHRIKTEWLEPTLPYQDWKRRTNIKSDMRSRIPTKTILRSLAGFAKQNNVNVNDLKQFFEYDFSSCRETTRDEYMVSMDVGTADFHPVNSGRSGRPRQPIGQDELYGCDSSSGAADAYYDYPFSNSNDY